jgi:hypothetical protein
MSGINLSWQEAMAITTILGASGACLLFFGKYFFETRKGCKSNMALIKGDFCKKIDSIREDISEIAASLKYMDEKRDLSRAETEKTMTKISLHMGAVNQYMHDHEVAHRHLKAEALFNRND